MTSRNRTKIFLCWKQLNKK